MISKIVNFFSSKILLILIIIILGMGLTIGYQHLKNQNIETQIELLQLQKNNLTTEIEKQNKSITEYIKQVENNNKLIMEYDKKITENSTKMKEIVKIVEKHNLSKIAEKKPKILEKIINTGIEKERSQLEDLTKEYYNNED